MKMVNDFFYVKIREIDIYFIFMYVMMIEYVWYVFMKVVMIVY